MSDVFTDTTSVYGGPIKLKLRDGVVKNLNDANIGETAVKVNYVELEFGPIVKVEARYNGN